MGFGLNFIQILLIILFTAFKAFDTFGPQVFVMDNVGAGIIVGAICGDINTGLMIGATLALMSLGVVGLGGASVPNYFITIVITTIIAIKTGAGYEVGLTIGLPVGMLNMYLDVLIKIVGGTIQTKSQKLVDAGEFKKGLNTILITPVLNILQYVFPVALVLLVGEAAVNGLVSIMPDWLFAGLQLAGKILPVTGMAILLNYMPVKKHFAYLILGFVLYSYVGLSVLPIALIGFSLAVIYFQREVSKPSYATAGGQGDMEDE